MSCRGVTLQRPTPPSPAPAHRSGSAVVSTGLSVGAHFPVCTAAFGLAGVSDESFLC